MSHTLPPKALLYCRISSVKQRVEGSGLESQEHRCRQYAAAHGYEIEQVFKDDTSGGGDFMNRQGMVDLLAYLKRHNATNYVVIFDDLKRFARDTMFHLKLRSEFALYSARVECLNFKFEDTPEGKFVETIHAAQGQLEREQTGRQTIQKMQARMEQGYFVFPAPTGYRYERTKEHGKLLMRDEPIASIIAEALAGFADGRFQTQSEIKHFLDTFPEYPKSHNGKVHVQRVKDILTRPIYAGYVEHQRWNINLRKGQHDALISLETFQTNQERLAGKAKAPARKNINKDFPLRGFILCDDCQNPLTACWSKGKNKHHPYYHCHHSNCESYGKSIRRADLEGAFEDLLYTLRPTPELFAAAKAMCKSIWNFRVQYQKKRIGTLKAQKIEVESKVDTLIDLIMDANSPSLRKNYEKRLNTMERDKLVLEEKIVNCGRPTRDYNTTLRTAMDFLANPCILWSSDRLEDKHAVLKLVFSENLTWKRNEGLRTPKTTLPFKVLRAIAAPKSKMVPRR
ncbi:MAG: recombinase family protein [Algicola sp.]|nr:recombinase family protein [Algicola sp.]